MLSTNMSIIDFTRKFDHSYSVEYVRELRWNGYPVCPHCGNDKIYILGKGRSSYKCSSCRKKFSVTSHTIFDNTKLSLDKWLYFIYSHCYNKKNISSHQLAKNLGITQCRAWNMQMKLRNYMYQDDTKLSGIVEVDEAFCSKGNRWTRWGGITTRKEPIIGLIERGGNVVLKTIDDRKRSTILDIIKTHVEPGSTIYTDGYVGYKRLPDYYKHDYVEHSSHEYVRGEVYTNTIENVWSYFKKNIRNAHHSISNKHIQFYLDETAFRFNYRHLDQYKRFNILLKRCLSNKINNLQNKGGVHG